MKSGKRQIRLMGTIIDTWVYHDHPQEILDEVVRLLHLYERRFSANRPDSELMQVNKQAGLAAVKVHPDLFDLIRLGKEHSCAAGSHLNITIGPLSQLWRIGFSDARVPSQSEIDAKRQLIDPQDIILDHDQNSVFLLKKGMLLDLGALAKGYIADLIMSYLRQEGVMSALINLGGNILTMGPAPHHDMGDWRIGIQNPSQARGVNSLVLPIRDQSVVTSGIYERRLVLDGKAYHHILSSETGYPVASNVSSLTIISDKSVDGEIWTTRLFGKELPHILGEIAVTDGISGIVITDEGEVYRV